MCPQFFPNSSQFFQFFPILPSVKKSGSVLCEGVNVRYAIMEKIRLQYPLALMCRVFRVSASGYYIWRKRPLSKRAQEEARLELEIIAAHKRTRETCGPYRLQQDMADYGVNIGICRIRRIRKKLGLRCKQNRKFKATTNSRHKLPVGENLLEQKFEAKAPNMVWVADNKYISNFRGGGFPYPGFNKKKQTPHLQII